MELLTNLEFWELSSYVVTVVGLPFAIIVYWLDQRKERQNEEEELEAKTYKSRFSVIRSA